MERKSVPVYLNSIQIPGIEIIIVKPINQTIWMVDVMNMMRSERELIAYIPDYKKITERCVFEDKVVFVLA